MTQIVCKLISSLNPAKVENTAFTHTVLLCCHLFLRQMVREKVWALLSVTKTPAAQLDDFMQQCGLMQGVSLTTGRLNYVNYEIMCTFNSIKVSIFSPLFFLLGKCVSSFVT